MFEDLRVCRQEIFGREVDARKFRAVVFSGLLRRCKAAPFLCETALLRWRGGTSFPRRRTFFVRHRTNFAGSRTFFVRRRTFGWGEGTSFLRRHTFFVQNRTNFVRSRTFFVRNRTFEVGRGTSEVPPPTSEVPPATKKNGMFLNIPFLWKTDYSG